ncbi:hypothetical protein [Polaromonas sp. CG9_12]|nr:hypothetical protein [Polaromonas sp. CG9_12]
MPTSRVSFSLALLAAAALAACGSNNDDQPVPATPPATVAVGDTVALSVSGSVLSFDRATPATLKGRIAVSGLQANEKLVGLDMRPADGRLYALSNQARLYTLNAATGVATFKAALSAAARDDNPCTALTGSQFGVDFNPVADRLRVVSDTGLNLRIDVTTGAATTNGMVSGAAAAITAAAYSKAFAGTTSTQLYSLEAASGQVYLQDPPNNVTLTAPMALGGTFDSANGFDIDARNNTAYAALTSGGSTALYTVPLTAGSAATRIGTIGTGEALAGLALMQPATPKVYALTQGSRLASFDPAAPVDRGCGQRRQHHGRHAQRRCRRHHAALHRPGQCRTVHGGLQPGGRPPARDQRQRAECAHQCRHRRDHHRRRHQPRRRAAPGGRWRLQQQLCRDAQHRAV